MQEWRHSFVEKRRHEPKIWFDKCCIDPGKIDLDLRCLPIFLSGCDKLVIFCGTTYLSRLWCIMEIFSYIMMGGQIGNVDLIPVLADGRAEDDMHNISLSFEK